MKLDLEHIEQFTRGENPFKSLNIGKKVKIENWFKTWAPYNDYEIDDNLNIYVKGYLNLYNNKYNNKITNKIPDNLYIEGYLDVRWLNIISLPDNLHVEGYLDIRRTKITSLPDNLHVGGEIHKDFLDEIS